MAAAARTPRKGDTVHLERVDGVTVDAVVESSEPGVLVVALKRDEIAPGEVLRLQHTVPDDARYTAAAEVESHGSGTFRVRLVGEWVRVQTREFVRVTVYRVDLHVARSGSARAESADGESRDAPHLLDLSGGGLRFETRDAYARDELLRLEFHLRGTGPIVVLGRVLRQSEARSGIRQVGVRFENLDEATRSRIVTWVFAEQARRVRARPR